MSDFGIFFQTGMAHITDIFHGIDHILFVAALCLRYAWTDWRKLLVLVTAFTIGHSLTLALSTLDIIYFSRDWTEFGIAATIFITAIYNLFAKDTNAGHKQPVMYVLALVFGLIHGLGFSSMLKSMLGRDQHIVWQLLAFNLGLELGQLLILLVILGLSFIFVYILRVNRRELLVFVSGGIAAVALQMMIARIPIPKDQRHDKTVYLYRHSIKHSPLHAGTGYPQQPGFQSRQQV